MRSRSTVWGGSIVYGLLVLAGTALLGFVVAPALWGTMGGLFTIGTEARTFFSLLTLKAAPLLMAFSVVGGLTYHTFAARGLGARVIILGVNILVAWSIAATVALVTLG